MTSYQIFLLLFIKTGMSGNISKEIVSDLQRLYRLGLINDYEAGLGFNNCQLTDKGERVIDMILTVGKTISE